MTEQNRTEMLSVVSAKQWQFVTQDNLSTREAVEFLLNGMQVRTFPEILARVCHGAAPEQQLIEGLFRQEASANPDSIRRKVQNWMKGKSLPTDREEVFKICFALQLELEDADRLLTMLTEQSIHYRDRTEMIYAYCLKNKLDYDYACSLAAQFSAEPQEGSADDPATMVIRRGFQSVRTEEDLFAFILNHRVQPGVHHKTAHGYFSKMLGLLTGEDLEGEAQYSMEYVADTYLRLNMPQDKRSAKYTEVQKMVKKYWPGARSVKAMSAQAEDVSRKTLLLLYLVTGGVWDRDYDELDEAYIDPKEYLQTHCSRMNTMLRECGMRRIDPRNVFDYLVLYCMRPEDTVFMSDRMAELVGEIFQS